MNNLHLIDFVVMVLATMQAVEVWHHGEIFRGRREAIKFCKWDWISYLSQCMFCLSLWVAAVIFLLHYLPILGRFLLWSLAIARGANLLNDLTYRFNRTPKTDEEGSRDRRDEDDSGTDEDGEVQELAKMGHSTDDR